MSKILKRKCSNLESFLALTLLLSNNHMPKHKSQPTGISMRSTTKIHRSQRNLLECKQKQSRAGKREVLIRWVLLEKLSNMSAKASEWTVDHKSVWVWAHLRVDGWCSQTLSSLLRVINIHRLSCAVLEEVTLPKTDLAQIYTHQWASETAIQQPDSLRRHQQGDSL